MKVPRYITEVLEPWRYMRDHYGAADQLPLLVQLENCSSRHGPVTITAISIDETRQTVTLVTTEGAIEISEATQWKLRNGKTNNGTGKTIWTHDLNQ